MLNEEQKRNLVENYFDDREFPPGLTIDEEKYIECLSEKWSKSLLQIYGDIIEADRKLKE